MNFKERLYILGLISKIMAAEFSIVSFNGSCQLSIDGTIYPMAPSSDCSNIYKASVDVPINSKYKYICGGVEDVERTLFGNTTHNELFGRALTIYDMPEFTYPDSEPWSRTIGRTEVFDPSYVPIVIVDTDKEYFINAGGNNFNKITFILKDSVHVFNNVRTSSKNGEEDKFQFRVELRDNDNMYNRNVFKFRPSSYDPTLFRQILYCDIAHAIGNPAQESVAARVYLKDGTGIGLYVLQEDATTESFIKTTFYGNSDGSINNYELSPIYDCSTGADFNPDDPHHLAAFQSSIETDLKIDLKEMTRKLVDMDITNEDQIKDFDENWLDLNSLLKAMALEYLAGHWDSYWFLTSNFITYHPAEETIGTQYNYSKYKYYFVDQDFDQTWSVGMSDNFEPETFPTKKYTEFVGKGAEYWKKINLNEEAEPGTRVIIDKLIGCEGLETCPTKELFEKHLKSIVNNIFNPVALGRKVEGYKERLDEEMKWDTSLTRLHKGTEGTYHFTYNDFVEGIEVGVSSSYGIMDWTKVISDTVCKQFNMICNFYSVSDNQLTTNDQNDSTENGTISNNGLTSNPNESNMQNSNSESGTITNNNISTMFVLFTMLLSIILFY
ncbi:hypothetical protein BCR36DRAFT_364434 [Piromyces finnis]|uniref:Coth-domain-containing protein n=1 Tax=Piromyces finnis TaxID=1754191 RepID=A0A1Y1UTK8_9FUNG|nr:hypothetical protein BCR36DRAFT_364434 [Piromyces finnis]|eukprot:ORX41369.1 hypothetical protein BCR36DRAFT_364434 [Piromyces finnis]